MARFRDMTGRPGPASWELGSYPEGQEDFRCGGISWFEAAAYAEFAGKSLPTIYHWYLAAGVDAIFSDMLRLSNFDGKGVEPAGRRGGLGPWGALDMAGNVKEWCFERGRRRASLHPWRRLERAGLSLPRYGGRRPVAARRDVRRATDEESRSGRGGSDSSGARIHGDPQSLVPVADDAVRAARKASTPTIARRWTRRSRRWTTARRTTASKR